MKLRLERFEFGPTYTIGELFVNDKDECFVLEDVVRPLGEKVQNETAIPFGIYKVVIDFSEHFQKELPHLLNVPMFEGIRIHSGNTSADTEGCLLVGSTWGKGDEILGSRNAFNHLFPQLKAAFDKKEEILLEIVTRA